MTCNSCCELKTKIKKRQPEVALIIVRANRFLIKTIRGLLFSTTFAQRVVCCSFVNCLVIKARVYKLDKNNNKPLRYITRLQKKKLFSFRFQLKS